MSFVPLNRRQFIKGSALTGAAYALASESAFGVENLMDHHHEDFGPMPYPAPDWMRNAVIAEVPTRGFNVSNYKDPSRWRGPYGDTTYQSIAAKLDYLKDMGFNVLVLYSVYNCTPSTNLYAINFSQPNPDMGSLEDVRQLMNAAHQRGMYVMSNTNHYGVDPTSPTLNEHPNWFLPASQTISGQRVFDLTNPEARAYVVNTHAWWCTDIGLDGWRIDLGLRVFKQSLWSDIVSLCASRGKRIMLAPEGRPLVGYMEGSGKTGYPPIFDMQNSTWLAKIDPNDPYRNKEVSGHNVGEPSDTSACCAYNNPSGSCPREGCFRIKGSQFLYGHNTMFAPMVPWMLTGESFNATHLALPKLKYQPKMLHSWLDWTDVDRQKDTVVDFRRIGKLRADNKDIFHNNMAETKLLNVSCTSNPVSQVKPYARFIPGKKACIVVGNDNITEDVNFTLQIPLAAMGLGSVRSFSLTDYWAGTTTQVPASALASYSQMVPKDKSPGGGVRVLILSAANAGSAR